MCFEDRLGRKILKRINNRVVVVEKHMRSHGLAAMAPQIVEAAVEKRR